VADYTRAGRIVQIEEVDDIHFLYSKRFLLNRGRTTDTKEYSSEITAEWIIDHIEKFQQIERIHRKNSYFTKEHKGKSERPDATTEKQIAIKMFNQRELPGIGIIIDYETPLNDTRPNKAGEIDLLAFDTDKKILRILELKHPNSHDTMIHCVLEAYTYLKQVDKEKLIRDFNRDGNTNIPVNTQFVACPFVFRYASDGKEGFQCSEMQEDRPKLKKLMELLEIKPLIIEGDEGQYTAREL